MRFRPEFTYGYVGSETTLLFSLPQLFWSPEEGIALGNESISAAGLPISEWMRYDQAVAMRVRFTDAEYVSVMTMVEWCWRRKHVPLTIRLEYDNFQTEYSVYMEKPAVGSRAVPTRDPSDQSVWQLDFIFRSVDGTRIHLGIYDEILPEFAVTSTADLVYQIEEGGLIYEIHEFTTTGAHTFEVTSGSRDDAEVLIVGGGGGGGGQFEGGTGGGGGGGGRVVHLTGVSLDVEEGPISLSVGAGGPGQRLSAGSNAPNGTQSVFRGQTAPGGGSGGHGVSGSGGNTHGSNGGSGGGGGATSWFTGQTNGGVEQDGAPTAGMGMNGGFGSGSTSGSRRGGGGGGASQAGVNGGNNPATGGNGYLTSITGTATYYGGGGGGCALNVSAGNGGLGGGGRGGSNPQGAPVAGTDGLGGGGGGAWEAQTAAKGGSGRVIIRVRISEL